MSWRKIRESLPADLDLELVERRHQGRESDIVFIDQTEKWDNDGEWDQLGAVGCEGILGIEEILWPWQNFTMDSFTVLYFDMEWV
jgi:hypothetical protein